ncbi:MAG: GerMN domain-containing protein [Patescibacteria group bacterium]
MTQKILIIIIVLIIVLGGIILGVRFFSGEDNWICQNGEWTKHGQPSAPMPTTPCPGANINQPVENSNTVPAVKEIIVDNPKANEEIASPYILTGQAAGWYFEASFPVKLLDESGKEIATAIAQAQSDWMTTDFVPFKANLEFLVDKDQAGTLVFMNDNPSGLPELQKEFRLPVKLKGVATLVIKVFFGNAKKNPNAMDCRLVYPVDRKIAKTVSTARAALEELLKGPTEEEKANGYYTSINSGVKIQKLTIVDGVARVDFDKQLEFQVGGSCRVAAINSQIVTTLKQFTSIKQVIISINGRTEDILQP